jgi:hypothetical protein
MEEEVEGELAFVGGVVGGRPQDDLLERRPLVVAVDLHASSLLSLISPLAQRFSWRLGASVTVEVAQWADQIAVLIVPRSGGGSSGPVRNAGRQGTVSSMYIGT